MPKTAAKTPRKNAARRNGRSVTADARKPSYRLVVEDGRTTHVILPLDEYERLVRADLADRAIARLDDGSTEWVDADAVALELAGRRIAAARKAKGLSQKELGEKLKLPQSQISRIERHPDHTTVRTLKKVAQALGVDVRALL